MVNVDEAIIAKYEYSGEHFEILVDPDLAAEFRNPDGQDVAIEDLLAVEEIFKDSKKGDKASEEAMTKIFETTDPIEVSKIILEKGTVQLTAEQKRGSVAGSAYSVIHGFGDILNEEWQQDGSWIGIVEMPGGLQDSFAAKMAEISSGEAETKTIK